MGLSRTLPIFMFVLLLFSGATLVEPRIALQSPVVNLTSFQVGYYIDDSQTLGLHHSTPFYRKINGQAGNQN